MRVTIFGATGGVGRHAVKLAVESGHDVTAVVRSPEKLETDVRFITADLATASVESISNAVRDADGVLSCLGPRSKVEAQAGIVTRGTRLIVAAMKETDARRLIAISAVPVGTISSPGRPNPPKRDPGDGFMVRTVLTPIVKAVFRDTYRDLAEMEDVIRESGLDWTIARPPRLLDKKLTGRYRTDAVQNLAGGRAVSRADLAHFMVNALETPGTIGQAVRIAY